MNASSAVAVTGLGLVSPLGIGVEANWAGLLAGASTAATDPLLQGLSVDFCCAVPGFDGDALLGRALSWRLEPYAKMALVAARQAVADAGLDPESWDGARVAVILGVGGTSTQHWDRESKRFAAENHSRVSPLFISRCLTGITAGEISTDLGAFGPSLSVSTACASGATAIGLGRDLLRAGSCDIAVVGGAESGRARIASIGFSRMGALSTRGAAPAEASRPFDAERDGFVLGEGAGMLVLERAEDARARSARVRGHVAGYGASADAHHYTTPDPEGRGTELATRTALADAGLTAADIGHINAHGTATPLGDVAEAGMLARVFPHAPPVTATKSLTGHTLGAAGALEAAFTLLTLANQQVPPTANLERVDDAAAGLDLVADKPRDVFTTSALSTSFGFGGQNAALVLTSA
ncbi:beta-ketoacyl-[acyl-carrier-protein] synthase family protein [Streptomyces coelicoflavus]|uniref:beta-ketoacyl-[acyl-carrier-protein] synthase family protein n=1 Tax=Streptomyces coelicoflavus TaxID=285562 RepID=UPI00210F1556|nr:beta-ketoacyl-[acyl-carrier-protein] synthase family protein [Streptomyces coelicoflavus]MCQ4203580.1 beta-ketoacyl-[acyl-carrier-protein] synthase family protein [Streptomyces coelicoflavus]